MARGLTHGHSSPFDQKPACLLSKLWLVGLIDWLHSSFSEESSGLLIDGELQTMTDSQGASLGGPRLPRHGWGLYGVRAGKTNLLDG